ncbi:MAG: hypothetical protein NVSMB9_00400 [Isosphaeraceae bacterium]
MKTLVILLHKHFLESRLVLLISAGALLAIAILTSWVAKRYEQVVDQGELERAAVQFRFFRALGGSAMDYSSTALQVCWYNHPVVVLTVVAWAISRGSAAVAGEIERGTVDLTLSRPVSRHIYLLSHIIFAILGLMTLAGALVLGDIVGGYYFHLKSLPTFPSLLRPALIMIALGLSVFGYTLPFSSLDGVRWRPTLAGSAITLAGLIAMSIAPQFEGYEWMDRLSVFRAYAPVTMALERGAGTLLYNAMVLVLVFASGSLISFILFLRRDLPSNS